MNKFITVGPHKLSGPQLVLDQLYKFDPNDVKIILDHQVAYEEGNPTISDQEFDQILDTICKKYGSDVLRTFIYRNNMFEFVHDNTGINSEMISLYKIKNDDEHHCTGITQHAIHKFFANPQTTMKPLLVSPKFDGTALKVRWNNNLTEIEQIITRGGIDVTELLKNNPDIQASKMYNTRVVCGELICSNTVFETYYVEEYKNPRNFVGSLTKRTTIDSDTVQRLNFIVYSDGINPLGMYWKTFNGTAENMNIYWNFLRSMKKSTENLKFDFNFDGVVIAVDSEFSTRPIKDNYPLNMVAVKFKSPTAIVTVTDIEWSQKKSGNLIPTVIFETTHLDGSDISRAAGFNYENISVNKIGVGARIQVTKSGDIIPYILKVVQPSEIIPMPDVPYKMYGKHLVSQNEEETKVFKFVNALKLLQIQGIGETLATKIGEALDWDIFNLFDQNRKTDIHAAIGGGSNWGNFCMFYDVKSIYFNLLIELFQFNGVGPKVAERVAHLIAKTEGATANGIPEKVLIEVCSAKNVKYIRETIQRLATYGIKVLKPISIDDTSLTYEMSGNPKGMSKAQFSAEISKKYPKAVHTTLTKSTKYLITDNVSGNTSKILKARKYNITILTYEQVLKDGFPKQ